MQVLPRPQSLTKFTAMAMMLFGVVPAGPSRAKSLVSELKIGGLYHDVPRFWSGFQLETRSLDINIETLFGPHIDLSWGMFRPAFGATINTSSATSKFYLDARWEIETPSGIFLALIIGAAVHDGKIGPTANDGNALGSRLLFDFPAELGWRWDGHHSLSIYFEHISNGYTQDDNEGLDTIDVPSGHRS